jgi:hypothetical protein
MPVTVILLGDGPAPGLPPDVEILHVADRREGWKRASGSRIAVFDTRYSAGPDWTAGLHAQGTVGGVVLPGKDLAWSGWVYYVIEYGWRRQLVRPRAGRHSERNGSALGKCTQRDELCPGEVHILVPLGAGTREPIRGAAANLPSIPRMLAFAVVA